MARGKKTAKELTPEEKLAQALVPVEEQPYQIPENWCWTIIGSLASIHRGVSYKKSDAHLEKRQNDCLVLRGGNIGEGYLDTDTDNVYVDISLVGDNQIVRKNDIIIVASTGSKKVIGRAGISKMKYSDVAFGAFLVLVRPLEETNQRYIDYFFLNDNYRNRIRNLASGVNINNIRSEYISGTPIPLPPLAEQQRIVDRIESIFAKLDEAKEKAQEVVDGFELRRSAILHKAFTGELTKKWRENNFSGSAAEYLTAIQKDNEETTKLNFKFWTNNILPEGWVESKIGNLLYYAGRIGWKGLKADEYKDEGPLLLSVYNLNEGDKVSYNKVYHISEQRYDESPEIMVQENDILLVKDGAGIGKLAYVKDLPQKSTINSSLLLIRSGESAYYKYIYYLLSGPSLQRIVKERITGSATPHLFQRDIKEFTIPIPPLQEQKFIASVLDNMIKKEQQAKETAEVVIEQIDVMKKAVLARAFRGELGTNNPEEESAVELLKSII